MKTPPRPYLIRQTPHIPLWQRNYYEHVIREENCLSNVRQYIATNPLQWVEDENHPRNSNDE